MTTRELGEQQLGVPAPQSPQCWVLLEELWEHWADHQVWWLELQPEPFWAVWGGSWQR